MTKKLFWDDAYQKEFDATVTAIKGNNIILDQTCFFPKGGGQLGDTGEINGIKVLDTIKRGDDIVHVLESEPNFKVGDVVHGKIDWNRRYMMMRMHTAAHVISEMINRDFNALITGNQLDIDQSRIDYNTESFDREGIMKSCENANEIIQKDLPVKIYFMKREEAMKIQKITKLANALPPQVEELRIVEIEGVDMQADGGTHVKSLKEIGEIEIVKLENKGKNNRRLYYVLK